MGITYAISKPASAGRHQVEKRRTMALDIETCGKRLGIYLRTMFETATESFPEVGFDGFHVFVETDSKAAAHDCGATG
jgi:hypothetical protein